ncbi:hypothetical protein [Phytohabitans houttuyneae]|uniref:Lipoprotein n=1 Tax=Phytohabitans houttuyneae TaxID=1076126 RepID=A0A6V8KF08_9ACTN|nr:hypothetical protein [Phytohabitans houttuyneae]GFJ80287.1 hypothetical protein Phou_044670 [Phytohabitans houttuyneae]
MKMAYGRLCVLAVLVLAGCTSPPAPTPGPSPSPSHTSVPVRATSAPPQAAGVTIERSGGFVGVDQSVTVDPDGRWTYYRNRAGAGGGTPVRGRLNEIQLADLQALLADPKLGTEAADPGECADGFVYKLVTGATRVEWADCGSGQPPTAVRVVELLSMSTPF